MKKALKMMLNEFIVLVFFASIFLILMNANQTDEIITYNVSSINSIQAIHLVSKYNPKIIETIYATNINEVAQYGSSNPVVFNGTMTGYGPDCEGCSGIVACPPRTDVRNGNIYFNDSQYGTVRIVAADRSIPCGTIVNITNSSLGEQATAIVLDRGGVINGTLMDLLVVSERASSAIGRQHVTYEVVRWGW